MRFIISVIFSFAFLNAFSQAATISGQVLDSKTLSPLPFANAFINNTTIGSATDKNGNYKITNVPVGQNEVVFSFVGYESYQIIVDLTDRQQLTLNVRLDAADKMLEDVRVQGTRDKEWERQVKKFTKAFLGTGKNVSQCKIMNPWVLEFTEEKDKLSARASDNLMIENEALGYKLSYGLKRFTRKGDEFSILGYTRFEKMKTAEATTATKWIRNRWTAYSGSQRHFLRSILDHTYAEEGFMLYNDKPGYENSPRTPSFIRELGGKIEEFDTARIQILRDTVPYQSIIVLNKRLEVHYKKGRARVMVYDDVIVPVSWIDLRNGSIRVNARGNVLDPENIVTSGNMSTLRVADMLPDDYEPNEARNVIKEIVPEEPAQNMRRILAGALDRFYEKVYVHTDKQYYYPGEHIWFKAYMNYFFPSGRDSLSQTLYVELLNPEKGIAMEKILRLDSGFASNEFILPDTIHDGTYYLRAYTSFQRNFGDKNLFTKSLPILKLSSRPSYKNEKETLENPRLSVTPNKVTYKRREKITLKLLLKDSLDDPIAGNFSVSVTDASQVINIKDNNTILEKFVIKDEEVTDVKNLRYLAEYGVNIRGQFLNNKGIPERTVLNFIQLSPYFRATVETDDGGYFQYFNLHFYDTASFSINSLKGKGKQDERVRLLKRETPPVIIKDPDYSIEVVPTQTSQRIFSEYEKPIDSKMLKAVEIKAKRDELFIKNTKNINHPYGVGDYVFDESKIKTQFPNLLYTLQALNISGLIVNPNTQTVYFARQGKVMTMRKGPGGTLSDEEAAIIAKTYTPLVTLDGNPLLGGSAGESLMVIDPNTVGSIEVTKGSTSIRGTLAPFGVIAVFTKSGAKPKENIASLKTLKAIGYSSPVIFKHPNYENPEVNKTVVDYRSTLYWNPDISINASNDNTSVSFFASDLVGTYRIVIEGVDANGEPVRSVSFIGVVD